MIEKRVFSSLGKSDHGWLKANFHFSFADYHDPARMGWGRLRVLNDDVIAAGNGFPPHPHANMEIITYVSRGAISHRDSLGNEGHTVAGDVQVMSAGTGITHAEYNHEDADTRSFQLWILPDAPGGTPRWDSGRFADSGNDSALRVLASGDEREVAAGAMLIRADARVFGATVPAGATIRHPLTPTRKYYLVAINGQLRVNGLPFDARDGAAITDVAELSIEAVEDSEILLVDSA